MIQRRILYSFIIILVTSMTSVGVVRAQVADSTLNKRFQLAESFMRAGQYDRALPLLEELYHARPDAFVFYDRLKQAYENLKQYPRAIALVERQFGAQPMPIHLAEKARLLFLAGREDDARRTWESAIALRPDDAGAYRTVYQSMYLVRLIDEAIEVLTRGRQRLGPEAGFHAELGALYAANAQYDEATTEYLALLLTDDRQLGYVRNRFARLAEVEGALGEAVRQTEQAVRRNPNNIALRDLIAWLYLENHQYLEALDAFRALDRLGDRDGRALFNFAQQAGDAGAFEAASAAFAELLSRYPDAVIAPDALYGRAWMHELWGRAEGERFASGDPNSTPHTTAALEQYESFLATHPAHQLAVNARYRVARLNWEFFGNLEAAEAALEEIIVRSPDHPIADDAQVDLGVLAVERGALAEARRIFARVIAAIQRSDLVERARYQLALVHLYEGDIETALSVAAAVNRNTSMDVANDAIELWVLLQENKGPDSLNTVLRDYGKALYLERRGDLDGAFGAIEALLRTNGSHPIADDARFTRARLLRSQGRSDDAWQAFAELQLQHPASPLADRALFHAAAILADDLQNDEQALSYYTRLLTEYPGSVLSAEARARIRLLRGDGV